MTMMRITKGDDEEEVKEKEKSGMNGERSELMRKRRMNRCQFNCKIDDAMSVFQTFSTT